MKATSNDSHVKSNTLPKKQKTMKVLVTGSTGFIGRYVVEELLNQSYQVIATSRDKHKAEKFPWFSQVEYIPCDLNLSQDDFFQFFHRPDLLIHLAWEGLPHYNELFHFEKNLFSNYRFLKQMIETGLQRLVVTGTCLEYGMQCGELNEEMETNPCNPYGLAKDTLRKFLEQLKTKNNFDLTWIRLFYMYGKGQNPNSLLSQLDKALEKGDDYFNMSKGEQLRDYLPVEKVAENIINIATQGKLQGIFNCCSGVPVSIKRFVEEYLKTKHTNIPLNLGFYPYTDYEPMAFWGDVEKLKKTLNT